MAKNLPGARFARASRYYFPTKKSKNSKKNSGRALRARQTLVYTPIFFSGTRFARASRVFFPENPGFSAENIKKAKTSIFCRKHKKNKHFFRAMQRGLDCKWIAYSHCTGCPLPNSCVPKSAPATALLGMSGALSHTGTHTESSQVFA